MLQQLHRFVQGHVLLEIFLGLQPWQKSFSVFTCIESRLEIEYVGEAPIGHGKTETMGPSKLQVSNVQRSCWIFRELFPKFSLPVDGGNPKPVDICIYIYMLYTYKYIFVCKKACKQVNISSRGLAASLGP